MMKKRTGLIAILAAIGVGGVAVAQIQNDYADPRLATPVDTALRESAVDAVLSASFPTSPPKPSTPPAKGQIRTGSTLEIVELSPNVWFGGTSLRVPLTENGFFLARKTANGSYVNVPGPGGVMTNAAYDGTNIVLVSTTGVFAAPAAQVAAGTAVWTRRSTRAAAPDEPPSDASQTKIVDRQFSCVGPTCIQAFRTYIGDRATGTAIEKAGRSITWSFDGFTTSTTDNQHDGLIAAGSGVIIDSTYEDQPSFLIPSSTELEIGIPQGAPRLARWSTPRQSFVGPQGENVVAFHPTSTVSATQLSGPITGLQDVIELPDGALLTFVTVNDAVVVSKNGREVFRTTVSSGAKGFGPYAGDNFVTIASDVEWQRRTLWSTKDGGETWIQSAAPATIESEIAGVWARQSISIGGADVKFTGLIETGGSVTVSGANQQLLGGVSYGTTFVRNGAGGSVLPAPVKTTVPTPLLPKVADYAPSGPEAAAAGSLYTAVVCTNTVWSPTTAQLQSGRVFYVPCNVQVSGANINGKTTIVSTGTITVSGAAVKLAPASLGQPVLLAGQSINVSGAASTIAGQIVAAAAVTISGANGTFCGLAADTISTTGALIRVSRC